jgi:nitroimidazol reductase NimA-like FMN-containing flavoprotein (pyridoxamine 5'-phosphate oxidase superfamily)
MPDRKDISLDQIVNESSRFGRNAYIASVSKSSVPFVSPVTFNWFGEDLLTFLASNEQKVKNCRVNAAVNIHFPVSEANNWDSLLLWGTAKIIDDTQGREYLWDKMGYNCNLFEPGGPSAETHVFMQIHLEKGLVLRRYGIDGREVWRRES